MNPSPSDAETSRLTTPDAPPPFNNPAADTILRSSDGVDFCVYSVILTEASPFFKGMFSLPQPSGGAEAETGNNFKDDGRPVVDTAEDSKVLNSLLRLCYPITEPVLEDLHDVELVLEAANKYEMEQATARLTRILRTFVDSNPLRVWAIATRLRLEAEALYAAKKTLGLQLLDSFPPEMRDVSAGAYYRLLKYHREKGSADRVVTFSSPPIVENADGSTTDTIVTTRNFFDHSFADVVCRSSDGVDLPVHRIVLHMASPTLLGRVTEPSGRSSEGASAPAVLQLEERGSVLAALMKLCYPIDEQDVVYDNLHLLRALKDAAVRYEMRRVGNAIQKSWERITRREPLRAYLLVAKAKLWDYAREAARRSLRRGGLEDEYIPEMENVAAEVYHRLLKYREACRAAVAEQNAEVDIEAWWHAAVKEEVAPAQNDVSDQAGTAAHADLPGQAETSCPTDASAQAEEILQAEVNVENENEMHVEPDVQAEAEAQTEAGVQAEAEAGMQVEEQEPVLVEAPHQEAAQEGAEPENATSRPVEPEAGREEEDKCRCGKHGDVRPTRQKCLKCARQWISDKVQTALETVTEEPETWNELSRDVLVQSVEAGCWCSDCEQIARFFTRMDAYMYKTLREVVSAVKLEIDDETVAE